jgi:hypothetical protein
MSERTPRRPEGSVFVNPSPVYMRHAIVCEDLWGAAGAQLVGPLVVSAHRLSWYRVQGAPPVKVHP